MMMGDDDDDGIDIMKEQFYFELKTMREKLGRNNRSFSRQKYRDLVDEVMSYRGAEAKKIPRTYWLMKHYDVLTVQGADRLIVPITRQGEGVRYYVHDEELFSVLREAHLAIGHGGRDRMKKHVQRKYVNVTRAEIRLFLQLCVPCRQKRKSGHKSITTTTTTKPMLFCSLSSRCQVDLIDYQSRPDGDYKFVLVYEDRATKFVVLKPLASRRADEVAYRLLDVFALLGAPSVLQSGDGREFSGEVIENLRDAWPELKLVHGRSRGSGGEERAGRDDVEKMIAAWMEDSRTMNWSRGLGFVQFAKNRSVGSETKRSPYEAMFRSAPKVGLASSDLPPDVVENITTEEELESVVTTGARNGVREDGDGHRAEERDNTYSDDETEPLGCSKNGAVCGETNGTSSSAKLRAICPREASDCSQAKRRKTDAPHSPANVGSTVVIPVPQVDGDRVNAGSVLAVVLDVTEDGLYRLGTQGGVISQLYRRSQFSTCPVDLLDAKTVPRENKISLCSAATAQSVAHGQGFRCFCKQKCRTNKCACKKEGVLCNSKCHGSLNCSNKRT